MSIFLRDITFHGILLDALIPTAADNGAPPSGAGVEVAALLAQGIQEGAVQPLQTTTFGADDVEGAFRYMAQGKNIGKVLIQVGTVK
jgi:fatty acid synthase